MQIGRGWWALAGFGVLTLLALYVGAYFVVVERRVVMKIPPKSKMATPTPFPKYRRIFGVKLDWLFTPMHLIDKKLRPETWEPGPPRPVPGRIPPRIPESERF